MSAQFTPGPWHRSGNYIRNASDGTGIRVAWICGDGPQPEWVPNAKLIAAAPELYAALEAALGSCGEMPLEIQAMASAALEKARA